MRPPCLIAKGTSLEAIMLCRLSSELEQMALRVVNINDQELDVAQSGGRSCK